VSTLAEMIQLQQFQFNHISTLFFKSLLLIVHIDSVVYMHLCSQDQKDTVQQIKL